CAAPARLGLTATPQDGERGRRTEDIVGSTVFRLAVDALTGGWLAPLDVRTWQLDLTPAERKAYDAEIATYLPFCRAWFRESPGAGWADFLRDARRTPVGRAAVAAWRRSRAIVAFPQAKRRALTELIGSSAGRRVLDFTADTEAAYAVAREHLVPVVTAAIGSAERAVILSRFEAGDWPVLVSARVLNEGVDVPGAETAIVVGGSQGSREYVQRVGRVLRPAAGKQAVVYDLVMRDTFEVAKAGFRQGALHG
ncbi:MAG: ATP-dependent helicase, partial [Deltaproteobacteria bacterium]|nr:ATP-dependent helicase [Deltaproteobacteria bacterium]